MDAAVIRLVVVAEQADGLLVPLEHQRCVELDLDRRGRVAEGLDPLALRRSHGRLRLGGPLRLRPEQQERFDPQHRQQDDDDNGKQWARPARSPAGLRHCRISLMGSRPLSATAC